MRVEVVPGGDLDRTRPVADLAVWNVSALAEDSEYRYAMFLDDRDTRFARPWPRPPHRHDADRDVIEAVTRVLGHVIGPWAVGTVRHRRSDPWSVLVGRIMDDISRPGDAASGNPTDSAPEEAS